MRGSTNAFIIVAEQGNVEIKHYTNMSKVLVQVTTSLPIMLGKIFPNYLDFPGEIGDSSRTFNLAPTASDPIFTYLPSPPYMPLLRLAIYTDDTVLCISQGILIPTFINIGFTLTLPYKLV
jgi:hypothetical protein